MNPGQKKPSEVRGDWRMCFNHFLHNHPEGIWVAKQLISEFTGVGIDNVRRWERGTKQPMSDRAMLLSTLFTLLGYEVYGPKVDDLEAKTKLLILVGLIPYDQVHKCLGYSERSKVSELLMGKGTIVSPRKAKLEELAKEPLTRLMTCEKYNRLLSLRDQMNGGDLAQAVSKQVLEVVTKQLEPTTQSKSNGSLDLKRIAMVGGANNVISLLPLLRALDSECCPEELRAEFRRIVDPEGTARLFEASNLIGRLCMTEEARSKMKANKS